jgi:hypothetical protein
MWVRRSRSRCERGGGENSYLYLLCDCSKRCSSPWNSSISYNHVLEALISNLAETSELLRGEPELLAGGHVLGCPLALVHFTFACS